MKLLYSLILSFFIASSLYSDSISTCVQSLKDGNSHILGILVTDVKNFNNYSLSSKDRPCKNGLQVYCSSTPSSVDRSCINDYTADVISTSYKILYDTDESSCEDRGYQFDDDGVCSPPPPPDFDGDGTPDSEDPDIDGDGTPNDEDNDDDNDGIPDEYDDYIGTGTSNGGGTDTPPNLEQSCKDLYDVFNLSCPQPPNKQVFNCTELDNGLVYITAQECLQDKAPELGKSPCDDMLSDLKSICDNGIEGSCSDNGLKITKDTLKCKDDIAKEKPQDCSNLWYEKFNNVTQKCECEDGYFRNSWGNCTLPDDSNASSQQIQAKHEKEAQEARTRNKDKEDKKLKDNIDSKTDTTNSTLSRIANTLDDSNQVLKDIRDKNVSVEFPEAYEISEQTLINNSISSYLDTVSSGITVIGNDFTRMKSKIEGGFTTSISAGSSPNFQINLHGRTLVFDLCSAFGLFSSVFYYIFNLIFTYIGLRIFFYSFQLKV